MSNFDDYLVRFIDVVRLNEVMLHTVFESIHCPDTGDIRKQKITKHWYHHK